jgi:hypothetical protein
MAAAELGLEPHGILMLEGHPSHRSIWEERTISIISNAFVRLRTHTKNLVCSAHGVDVMPQMHFELICICAHSYAVEDWPNHICV